MLRRPHIGVAAVFDAAMEAGRNGFSLAGCASLGPGPTARQSLLSKREGLRPFDAVSVQQFPRYRVPALFDLAAHQVSRKPQARRRGQKPELRAHLGLLSIVNFSDERLECVEHFLPFLLPVAFN
jgi:hypothetical protein